MRRPEIVNSVKNILHQVAPEATAILYGSEARGDAHEDSDIDVLVLLDKEKVTQNDREQIAYPVYHIGYNTDTVISVMFYTKQSWEGNMRITPFYHNVMREGIVL